MRTSAEIQRIQEVKDAKLREATLVCDWEERRQEGIRRANLCHDRWVEYREAARRGATSQELRVISARISAGQALTTRTSQPPTTRASQASTRCASQVQAQESALPGVNESDSDAALEAARALLGSQKQRAEVTGSGFALSRQAGLFTGVYVQTEPESVGLTEIFQVQLEHAEIRGRLLELQALRFQEILQFEREDFKKSLPRLIRRVKAGRRHRRWRFPESK